MAARRCAISVNKNSNPVRASPKLTFGDQNRRLSPLTVAIFAGVDFF